jgi:hypothetical protein
MISRGANGVHHWRYVDDARLSEALARQHADLLDGAAHSGTIGWSTRFLSMETRREQGSRVARVNLRFTPANIFKGAQ